MRDHGGLELPFSMGRRLALYDYRRDFRKRDEEVVDRSSWKFERRQYFYERGDPSREAFRGGKWRESLRLLDAERDELRASALEDEKRGNLFHRVRIVQEPLTPYLQWELHALRVQGESGHPIRVVQAEVLRPWEGAELLPEVVVLGGRTLYEVVYTDSGILDGGIRFTETELTGRWESFIKELFAAGEDVISYTDRRVVGLPPPQAGE